jgi:hypothetical protein
MVLGFRVWGVGFRVQGIGHGIKGSGKILSVKDSGFMV